MTIGLPDALNVDVFDFNTALTILSSLDDKTRAAALKQFKDNGHWPGTVDHSHLLRRLDDYSKIIQEDQKKRENNARRDAKASGQESG